MVLNIGGSLFGEGNSGIIGLDKEEEITLSRENGQIINFIVGAALDTGAAHFFITAGAFSTGLNAKGWKTTIAIRNMSGAADTYNYTIKNLTKGTTLKTVAALAIGDQEYNNTTDFWNLDQISPGDTMQFDITDGVIGTGAGEISLGYISFYVYSVDKSIFT